MLAAVATPLLGGGCWLGARGLRSGRLAAGKSEFGVCGVVGGMMVIERMMGNARRRIGG